MKNSKYVGSVRWIASAITRSQKSLGSRLVGHFPRFPARASINREFLCQFGTAEQMDSPQRTCSLIDGKLSRIGFEPTKARKKGAGECGNTPILRERESESACENSVETSYLVYTGRPKKSQPPKSITDKHSSNGRELCGIFKAANASENWALTDELKNNALNV